MNGTAIRRHANGYQRKDEAIRACRKFAAIGVELSSFCGWVLSPSNELLDSSELGFCFLAIKCQFLQI